MARPSSAAPSSPCVPPPRDDIPAFVALGRAVVPPTYGPIDAAYAQRMIDEWWTPEVFTRSMQTNAHLVAEVDGEVVALATLGRLSRSYRDFPHVTGDREVMWKLYVHPDHHGRGIGSRLLAEVESRVEGDQLWLEVVEGNEQAFVVLPLEGLRRGRARDGPRVARRRLDDEGAVSMSRFQKYDGGDPLAPPVDLAEALDAIGQDVMAGYSPEHAMREFLRRGSPDQTGLDELQRQLAQRRRDILQRNNLDGTMQEVRELLDKAVLAERGQLARDITMSDEDRDFREMVLDNLSPSTAAAVSELSSYDWQSSEAREAYEEIKDLLGRELLDQRFAGMKQALEGATDEDRAAVSEMLSDLNDLLEKHAAGGVSDEEFADFMDKHGDFFPEQPKNMDELLDSLAQRAAAAQRMLNSMTEEQRQELMELSQQAFGSPQLMEQLARMDANLQALRPGEDWSGSESFEGDQGMGLGDGTGALQDLAQLDQLSDQLVPVLPGRPARRRRPRRPRRPARPRGRGRGEDPAGARAGAARQRLPQAWFRR